MWCVYLLTVMTMNKWLRKVTIAEIENGSEVSKGKHIFRYRSQ